MFALFGADHLPAPGNNATARSLFIELAGVPVAAVEIKLRAKHVPLGLRGRHRGRAGTPPVPATQAKWDMLGPQFDFDGRNRYTGQFYEQATGRGIIAWRGQVVRTEQGKHPRLLGSLGDRNELAGYVHIDDWNKYHLIARGNTMTHIINGHVMSILIDDDPTMFRKSGLIG